MRLATLASLSLLLLASGARSQTCETGQATALLENAGVRAVLTNTGALFWDGDGPGIYEVPKGSGVDAIFLANLWVGGLAGGDPSQLRFAGGTYSRAEFWPGPLDADGSPPEDCAPFDRLWRVTLADIAAYNATGVATADLAEWPAHLGAPVVDGDGDPGNYDLARGDRPAILGDETVWWIMNDAAGEHEWSEKPALGVEVRVTAYTLSEAFALARLGLNATTAHHLHHATFYRYEITSRGDADLEETYVGLFADPDLGYYADDFVGSAPDQELAFVYNGEDVDQVQPGGRPWTGGVYGGLPPALGFRFLDGPAPKPLGTAMVQYPPCPSTGPCASLPFVPDRGLESYRAMQGLWRDGVPLTTGGDGYNPGSEAVTRYVFPGRPPAYWSEESSRGNRYGPDDRRLILANGPFMLASGETVTLNVAMPWARSEQGRLASVNVLLLEASPGMALVRGLAPDPALATIMPAGLPALPILPEAAPPEATRFSAAARPNPASGDAEIRFDLAEPAHVRLDLYDALGRRVAVLVDAPLAAAEHRADIDAARLAPGTYVYLFTVSPERSGALRARGQFVVAR